MAKKRKQKKRARPRGQPPKLRTPAQRARFLAKLKQNLGNKAAACRASGITTNTLKNECERDPEFAAEVESAKEAAIDELVARGVKLGLDGDGAMIRFLLPRLRPREYAQTQQVEHRGHIDVEHDVRIQVVEDDSWYGNDAHGQAAARLAASDPGPVIEGTVQGGSLRPAVGQNGHGANGHG